MAPETIRNYIGGKWVDSDSAQSQPIINPATGQTLAHVPLGGKSDVDRAAAAARDAFWEWRRTPPVERARYMFRLKEVMERRFDELARVTVEEEGKTIADARGEVRRGIENVEVAAGIPSLMMGTNLEDVARGIDTDSYRQPMGVFAAIAPFNFPIMVPLWFMPHAVALGNSYIVKPSEQVPLSQAKLFEMIDEVGFPPGVVNTVNGGVDAVNALLEHPDIKGISFVGSAPVARYIYRTAAANYKRVQALGGAKNFMVVMDDAVLDRTVDAIVGSGFGAAGERCLAGSVVLGQEGVYDALKERLVEAGRNLKVGYGMDPSVEMGPVVSRKHMERVVGYIDRGVEEGATLLLDGRGFKVAECPDGNFVGPTIFENVSPTMSIACDEIFGPVISLIRVRDLDDALAVIDASPFGNATSLFTGDGKTAREFRYRVQVGMVGVNIGVPAPMAFFTFTGWKQSFFGDLHGHGRDAIEFFTEKKVVISRWF
jgi:malonate-semialdehyde dehydrogenase (acetylating) / methylmalonate-semialdehyde dehydrogenase